MARLHLSAALSRNRNTRAILAGDIEVEGVELLCSALHGSEMFWRQLAHCEFDVSEMSMSSLCISIAAGDSSWVPIPVFTSRRFFHTGILINERSGVHSPADLRGKRVGVPEYQQTSAVWTRGILQEHFGVSPAEISWFMERPPRRSHGGATGFQPPPGVSLTYIDERSDIGEMLAKGALDATLLYLREPNLVDRSTLDLNGVPGVRKLFADPRAERIRFFRETGILPMNHCVVVRRAVAEEHLWILLNLYDAFTRAKALAGESARQGLQPFLDLGWLEPSGALREDKDPFPYGIVGQRSSLETLTRYVYEQGLTSRIVGTGRAVP